jgi:single-strand DNA-binding protein
MSTNRLFTSGNLTADPSLAYANNGTAYARFSIAVNTAKDQPAVFWNCTAFGDNAENLAASANRGDRVAIEGRIEADNFTGEDGVERRGLRVLVDEVSVSLRFNSVNIMKAERREPQAS